MVIASYFIINSVLPESWSYNGFDYSSMGVFYSTLIGLASGIMIGLITEYFTGTEYKPVRDIANQSVTGSATNIIAGLGVGMISTGIPVIIIALAIIFSYEFSNLYGIAIAAFGCGIEM